jgi:hypothetical protein
MLIERLERIYNTKFIIAYATHTLTISNLIIVDFNNPQVASAANPSAFSYYYSKHI